MTSPHSGSRWEPADARTPDGPAPDAITSTVAVEERPAPARRPRRRLVVAAVLVAVLAAAGAGAAAIGHAVAGTGSVGIGRDGGPMMGGRDGHRHGPDLDGDGGVGPGVGTPGTGPST